ncbi:MAG: DEAD/DEAH box helicase [Geothrix sp.]|uniref:DEAD/DEAH box helicase n=1 Tax=Geothrix sp. TaxID=1962974 RepID=UPI0017BC7D4C|nr:DEAD/DEAH box helicase [Geothrix sp.]NWJ42448.1 DEAD/DEAH box helicase [Geothrix sp.]WIL19588.1 MAG: DEAD/DEAH box helicase [Geothrix sp.]
MTFAALGCSEALLAALAKRGFETPMPVQAQTIQPGLEGRDLLVQSRTGSGKTLAFGLPLLQRLSDARHPQALILAPTRELAQQVGAELHTLVPKLPIASLVGGVAYPPQLKALQQGAQVIVGTPGRVMDHLERGTLDLSRVSMIVLDECDEMLNMGFLEDVETILAKVPAGPQTYLFSATLPAPIAKLAKRFLKDPVQITLAEAGEHAVHADIAHTPVLAPDHQHVRALVNLLLKDQPSSALIFTKTKAQTEEVAEELTVSGLPAAFLHGDLAQATRTRILGQFKEGKLRYLVATDVAARGLDIEGLPLVVHMGIPTQLESYIHRSGRTGRAGAKGTSMALVGWKESRILLAWSRRGGLKLDWRAVPTPAEIRETQATKLLDGIQGSVSPALLHQAAQLLKDADPVRLVAGLLGLVQADQASGFDLPNEPEKKPKSRFDSPRDRKEGGPRPQRTYAERAAARGNERPDSAFSKTRPDGSFKPRSDFEDRPRPYAKPKPEGAERPRKTWEDRPAKPEVKDTPRPWKPSVKPAGKPGPKYGEGPAKPWKKKG